MTYMKNIITHGGNKMLGTAVILAAFAMTISALAATVSFSPASITAKEGQNFNAGISVDAQGTKAYTVKLEIKFPADTLEVASFNFGSGWTALAQPGYDLVDNANGKLIKTAGYSGGLSSKASFGTIIFKSKKNGNGVIQVTTNSLALGADGKNAMSGLPVEASILITPVASSIETPKPSGQTPTSSPAPSLQPGSPPIQTVSPSISPTQTIEPSPGANPTEFPQPAQAISSLVSNRNLLLIVIAIAVAGFAGWIILKRKK